MAHDVNFTGALGVLQVHAQQVRLHMRTGIAHCQRQLLNPAVQRLPDVEEGHAATQQIIRLVWKQVPHALGARRHRVVAVHQHDCRALHRGLYFQVGWQALADGVVKHFHPLGTRVLLYKLDHLRIKPAAHRLIVAELLELVRERFERKALAVQRKTVDLGPTVFNVDRLDIRTRRVAGDGFRRLIKVVVRRNAVVNCVVKLGANSLCGSHGGCRQGVVRSGSG